MTEVKTKVGAPVPVTPAVTEAPANTLQVVRPDAPTTGAADRARVFDAAKHDIPPGLRTCATETMLGDALALHAAGLPLDPSSAAPLLFTLRSADLTRGDFLALRKHVLANLPRQRAGLHRTKAANVGNPKAEDIVTLLLATSATTPKAPPVVKSLAAAKAKLDALLDDERGLLREIARHGPEHDRLFDGSDLGAADRLAAIEPRIVEQRAIVESFARWADARFGEQIERFRATGRAVDPDDAPKLLYALHRHDPSESELVTLRDALLEGRTDRPRSARVDPPTVRSLFALMSGVEAADTIAGLDKQLERNPSEELRQIRDAMITWPTELLAAPIAAFGETGRAVAPYYVAILAASIDALELERPQLDRLQEALIGTLHGAHPELHDTIRAADDTKSLMKVLTGEVLGREPLPLERKKLTNLIAKTQEQRAAATEARLRLLDDKTPADLTPAEQTALEAIDVKLAATTARIEELADARAGVNAVRGHRWLDRLEVDVLAGGAVGVPGIFSGSAMGGVSLDEADPTTGRREKGLVGYAMPAFSVGGYGKLDVSYSRAEGFGVSGGGGVDFLGVWGGPGGESWGNVFAGGLWVPQVINAGVGYGTEDGEAYGAFILSTFWPPLSPAAGRVDTVLRHPSFAVGAQRGAELVKALSESAFIQGGRDLLSAAGSWLGDVTEPVFDPIQDAAKEISVQVRGRRAADGLEGDDVDAFIDALRVLSAPSDEAREAAGEDPEKLLELHRADVRGVLGRLTALVEANPEHMESCFLLSSAHHVLGDSDAAVDAAELGWKAAQATEDPRDDENARRAYVQTAIAHGQHERVWPTLDDWLGEGAGLVPRLLLVDWLAGQGRDEDAMRVAEGLASAHPRSFEAQRALARTSHKPPTAPVDT